MLIMRTTRAWDQANKLGISYSYNGEGQITIITTAADQDERIEFTYVATSRKTRKIEVGPDNNLHMDVEYTYKGDSGSYHADLGAPTTWSRSKPAVRHPTAVGSNAIRSTATVAEKLGPQHLFERRFHQRFHHAIELLHRRRLTGNRLGQHVRLFQDIRIHASISVIWEYGVVSDSSR